MTAKTTHHCNECGAELTAAQVALYSGMHLGATFVASGEPSMEWQSCGAKCAAAHLRRLADKVEAHEARWASKQAEVDANRKAFAVATAPGAPPFPAQGPERGVKKVV